jgi:hypothetical protein
LNVIKLRACDIATTSILWPRILSFPIKYLSPFKLQNFHVIIEVVTWIVTFKRKMLFGLCRSFFRVFYANNTQKNAEYWVLQSNFESQYRFRGKIAWLISFSYIPHSLLTVGLQDYHCTWSYLMTHTRYDSSEKVIGPPPRHLLDNTKHKIETPMIPTGFQPTIPASERPRIHVLQRLNKGIVQNRIQTY